MLQCGQLHVHACENIKICLGLYILHCKVKFDTCLINPISKTYLIASESSFRLHVAPLSGSQSGFVKNKAIFKGKTSILCAHFLCSK